MKKPIELSGEKATLKAAFADRRFFPRIQLQAQGRLKNASELSLRCTIGDVSSGGAQVMIDLESAALGSPVTEGDFVMLAFAIGRYYELGATITWTQRRPRQMVFGVEWSVTEDEVLNRLELEIARIIVNRRRLRGRHK